MTSPDKQTAPTNHELSVFNDLGYRFHAYISKGAFGKVLLSEYKYEGDGRIPLSCTVIDTKTTSKDFNTKFLPREIDVLKKVNHPYIVRLFSVYHLFDKYYIFTRLAEQGDLLEFITNNGILSDLRSKLWTRQLALALQYLHSLDIVHRNVKPENVLISSHNNVKLANFAFSRFMSDTQGRVYMSRTYCGSLPYVAPEILSKGEYDPKKCDVWSLGAVTFAMLNGRLPYGQVTSVSQLEKNVKFSKPQFHPDAKRFMTQDALDFLTLLLNHDPVGRVTMAEVVAHPWLNYRGHSCHMIYMEDGALETSQRKKHSLLPANALKVQMPKEVRVMQRDNDSTEVTCLTPELPFEERFDLFRTYSYDSILNAKYRNFCRCKCDVSLCSPRCSKRL